MKIQKMKTNVLYIIEELELGGAERVVIDLARSLDRSRFNVKVCCLRQKGEFVLDLENENIEVIELHKKPGIDLSIIAKTAKVMRDNKIDIVHTHLWVANFWGRTAAVYAKIPVVITEHNVDVWKKWYHRLIDKCLAGFTAKIVVVSQQVKRFYAEQIGIAPGKLEVIYNGIEPQEEVPDEFTVRNIRQELHIDNGNPVLVNIGRLVPVKAQHVFIESLGILAQQNIKFNALIIGDGPLKEYLAKQGQDLIEKGLLQLTGLRKDVKSILDAADISILSSTREGFSVVVLESMAKGVPFVATDVGGNSEQIADGETGFLVPQDNPKALATAMETILKNNALAEKMKIESRRRIREEFSLAIMVEKTEKLYEGILHV